jgi:hypothetical protein
MANTRVTAADVQITGKLDMRMHEITGLDTDLDHYPRFDDQGASKKYVDTLRDEVVANLTDVDNGDY